MPDISERDVTLRFTHGRPGGYEFISRYRGLVVIPCNECCPSLLTELRLLSKGLITPAPQVTVNLELCLKPLKESHFYIAHRSSTLGSSFPLFDRLGSLTLGQNPAYQLYSFGGGYAGSASCLMVTDEHDAFLIDCGASVSLLARFQQDSSGPNPLPDFDTMMRIIEDRNLSLQGLFVTHSHYDHIWAIYHLLTKPGRSDLLVYGHPFSTMFASQMVEQRQIDARTDPAQTFHLRTEPLRPWQETSVGQFTISAFPVFHSIPGSYGYVIRPIDGRGALVITGDYKARYNSPLDCLTFRRELTKIGPVRLLASDATNAELSGYTDLESAATEGLVNAIRDARGQVIITHVSSNLERLATIYQICRLMDKTMSICGSSLERAVDIYRASGSVMPRLSSNDPASSEVVVVTGCQADENSVLGRLSWGESVQGLRLNPRIRVINSSRSIPGREEAVAAMHERIRGLEVELFTNDDGSHGISDRHQYTTHVSGHGSKDDIYDTIEALQPEYFVPIHCNPAAKASAAQVALQASTSLTPANIILTGKTNYIINW